MKRTISVGEMIGFGIVVFGFIFTFYVSTNVRLTALELHQTQQVKDADEIKSGIKELNNGQQEIKIILQNKQDRK